MSIRKKSGLLILLLLALSACSELQQYKSNWPASVINGEQGADYWLAELHATRGMTADQQKQILKSREQELHDNPGSNNRLRVALLLATGGEEIRDHRRALTLVEEIDPASYDVSDQEMIAVFRQLLGEERKANRKIYILWKQLTEQSQQIEELEQQLTEQSQRVEELEQQLTEQSQRVEELEQQLKALTTIEQKIQQREKPVVIENE